MALTPAQKATLAEIARESYEVVDAQAASLNSAVEALLAADVTRWDALRSKHLRVKGGREGVDLDPDREREVIRRRVRKSLGLPMFSDEELEFSSDVMQLVEIDVGANFG